jgi:coproporphyrinogen III oxidase-like Fe-S oxidoreductase
MTFLGPATADRTATAHLLIHLLTSEDAIDAAGLAAEFDFDAFIRKRLDECREANLIHVNNDRVQLTGKGRALAKMFECITDCWKLQNWPEHVFSFRRA